MRRSLCVLAVTAIAAAVVVSIGAPVASGEQSDDPVGYTFGFALRGTAVPDTAAAPGDIHAQDGLICNFYKVDLKTAELTQINPTGTTLPCADGVTFDDDGHLYAYRDNPNATSASDFTQLITIDKDDGAQHPVGILPAVFVGDGGMTFDADGHLWLYADGGKDPQCFATGDFNCLWEVNAKNAHSDFVGATGDLLVQGLAADCESVLAISVNTTGGLSAGDVRSVVTAGGTQLDEVHTSSASLEKIADTPGVTNPTGLDFDAEGDLWAIGGRGFVGPAPAAQVFRIDPDNGNSGAKDITLNGVPFTEPLFGLGIAPVSCEDPEPAPPQPAPVVVQPTFTG